MFRVILYSNIVFLLVFFSPIYGVKFSITADGDAHIQEDKGVLVINKNIVINYMDNIIKTNSPPPIPNILFKFYLGNIPIFKT